MELSHCSRESCARIVEALQARVSDLEGEVKKKDLAIRSEMRLGGLANKDYREALDKIAHLDHRLYPEAVSIAVDTLESNHHR